MTKVLITGSSGTGKTEMANFLSEKGFNAFDADSTPGMTRLEVRESGEPVPWPNGYVDWNKYAYNLNGEYLKKILKDKNDIIISVVASNQIKYFPLFDVVIVLHIPEEDEHLRRLKHRDAHEFGQDKKNLLRTVEISKTQTKEWEQLGGIVINANQTKEAVVSEIISASKIQNPPFNSKLEK